MTDVLGSIWWLLVALGVLITFHEFGHYWVARRLGVKVLRFSVGFGKPLWKRTAKDGVEYMVAALPLGGYVKMLDEREGHVDESEYDVAFNRQSVWSRIAIVSAGPVFNLVFAVFAFWVMFMAGIPAMAPIVGETSGLAQEAGIRPHDQIVAVDGNTTETWQHAVLGLLPPALDREEITVSLEDREGGRRNVVLDLTRLGDDFREEIVLKEIGISEWRAVIPALIGEVSPDSPAESAGFRPDDRVINIGGEEVPDWSSMSFLIQKHGEGGATIDVIVERNGREVPLAATPMLEDADDPESRLILGITNQGPDEETIADLERAYFLQRHGIIDGLGAAFKETWRLTESTVGILGRMLTGSASVRNLSGPITIAQYANDFAQSGFSSFLFFLGLISLSLGILNLLPIPILDGGHLLYYLIELVKGSPVSEQVQLKGQYVGLVALFGLMSLAFVNDILRLVG